MVVITAAFLDLKIYCKYPRLFLIKLLLCWYKFFSVSDAFSRRVGRAYGMTSAAALEISTPLHVISRVYDYLGNAADSLAFVDLGCGYGDLLGYVAMTHSVSVFGVEKNPAVAEIAHRWVSHTFFSHAIGAPSCARVHILVGDIHEMPCVLGVYWLSWTGFSEAERKGIESELCRIPVGSVIVTTTYPIVGDFVRLTHRFRAEFFWGLGTVSVYDVVGASLKPI